MKMCFNAHCKDPKAEGGARRRAWHLRSGDSAELCDRCYIPFEQGNFCETFHSDVPGWRNCETCGKRLHCGCVVSAYAYAFRDAGGVDCCLCYRRSNAAVSSLASGQSPSLSITQQSCEKKDGLAKGWRAPSVPYPGYWRANLWNVSSIHASLQQRLALEFDRPAGEKLQPARPVVQALEKKYDDTHGRVTSTGTGHAQEHFPSVHSGIDLGHPAYGYSIYRRDGGNHGVQEFVHTPKENDSIFPGKETVPDHSSGMASRFNLDPRPSSSQRHPILKKDSTSMTVCLAPSASFEVSKGSNNLVTVTSQHPQSLGSASSLPGQIYSQGTSEIELQGHTNSGRPRVEAKMRSSLPLARYWPRIADQEQLHISGDSNSVITPLFEKVLSASDAGKVGRLVLPKKCAEAYLPGISNPEGIPLKVHDANGKEWQFQFRFWPNNNSRMYVLEGVTPCIQSMQLQAGDTVTFGRIDPDGKLIMGYRKASNLLSSEQDDHVKTSAIGALTTSECTDKILKEERKMNTLTNSREYIGDTDSKFKLKFSSNHIEQPTKTKVEKGSSLREDGTSVQPSPRPPKRRGSALGLNVKRLRIEREDSIDMTITWEETQNLLRPSVSNSSIVVIEGHDFEEYEEPPILGRKAHYIRDKEGNTHLWVQCEDCMKWRKLPDDVLLPFKWTCPANKWDPEKSSCSSAQELTNKQLTKLISQANGVTMKRMPSADVSADRISDGLETLANLAILGEGETLPSVASKPATTRHPRHRPGCTCIVCIQPPSGKGPKHKRTCTCNVCMTVRRRFKTLMMRREKQQAVKSSKTSRKHSRPPSLSDERSPDSVNDSPGQSQAANSPPKSRVDAENFAEEVTEVCKSPVKNHIDLNVQPERDEDQSSKSDASGECAAG